jgi:hypothetical protein
MKNVRSSAWFLVAIITCLLFLSCKNELSSSSDFLIRVDSVRAPLSVSSGTSFDVEFFGTVGYDECNSFKTFNKVNNNNKIIIEAWGTYDKTDGTCLPGLVLLDGQKLNLTIEFPGTYNIVIKEPENFVIIRQITVN